MLLKHLTFNQQKLSDVLLFEKHEGKEKIE